MAWFPASAKLPATATGHTDPDALPGKTEYRVCAGNVSGARCSEPVLAAVARVVDAPAVGREGVADTVLAQQVRDSLTQKLPRLAPKVQVNARHGVVTLTGSVPSPLEKLAVEKVTAQVRGVSQVENHLDVDTAAVSPATQPPPGIRPGAGIPALPGRP